MRTLLSVGITALLFWAASLAYFVLAMPSAPVGPEQKTEAIIVLTGGAERVERGLAMAAAGAAPVLFISGVGEHATVAQIMAAHASPAMRQQLVQRQLTIVLDHVANTTQTNATESEQFVAQHRFKTIRLVTAHYHMPRSLLVFRRAMPEVTIVPDAVFPAGFHRDEWWRHENTRRLLFSEYYKFYGALLGASKL